MSTNIQIDVVLQKLKKISEETAEQNRNEKLIREETLAAADEILQKFPEEIRNEFLKNIGDALENPEGLVIQRSRNFLTIWRSTAPDLYKKKRPAAQRDSNTLVPFAISWRGEVTNQPATVWSGTLFPEAGFTSTSTIRYTGGDYANPQPYEIAAGSQLISIEQTERWTEWNSTPRLCLNVCGPSFWIYEGWWAESVSGTFVDGVPGASFSNPVTLTTNFLPAPQSNGPTGPISHGADLNYLAVASDGTIFAIAMLPWEPIPISVSTEIREVFAANPGTASPRQVSGQQQKVAATGEYNGNAVRPPFTSKPLYKFAAGQPVLFLRIKNGKVENKTALYNPSTSFVDFYKANAYSDDPGKNLRDTYAGEVRIRGNQANKLRMRFTEVFDGATYTYYRDFPFLGLTEFVEGTGANAKLKAGVTFENHIYNLEPYTSDAQLATQLANIRNPTGYEDQPEFLPDKVVKLKVSPSFIAAAAKQISTSGSDVLTPLTYFVAMP